MIIKSKCIRCNVKLAWYEYWKCPNCGWKRVQCSPQNVIMKHSETKVKKQKRKYPQFIRHKSILGKGLFLYLLPFVWIEVFRSKLSASISFSLWCLHFEVEISSFYKYTRIKLNFEWPSKIKRWEYNADRTVRCVEESYWL